MRFMIDVLYRVGIGIGVCWALYRLIFILIPLIFRHYAFQTGASLVMVGIGLVAIGGPLFGLWLADWLLRSVSRGAPAQDVDEPAPAQADEGEAP